MPFLRVFVTLRSPARRWAMPAVFGGENRRGAAPAGAKVRKGSYFLPQPGARRPAAVFMILRDRILCPVYIGIDRDGRFLDGSRNRFQRPVIAVPHVGHVIAGQRGNARGRALVIPERDLRAVGRVNHPPAYSRRGPGKAIFVIGGAGVVAGDGRDRGGLQLGRGERLAFAPDVVVAGVDDGAGGQINFGVGFLMYIRGGAVVGPHGDKHHLRLGAQPFEIDLAVIGYAVAVVIRAVVEVSEIAGDDARQRLPRTIGRLQAGGKTSILIEHLGLDLRAIAGADTRARAQLHL